MELALYSVLAASHLLGGAAYLGLAAAQSAPHAPETEGPAAKEEGGEEV